MGIKLIKAKEKISNWREKQLAVRVSVVSIGINVVLSLLKLAAGIFAASSAMISDAVHSASDVFSTIIVIIGVKVSEKQSDLEHPYGHERLECVASIILAVVLAVTGLGIGYAGFQKIAAGGIVPVEVPGKFSLITAMVSIAVKEWMFWYTRAAAKKLHSGALMADAWHHRSDAMSSVGAFIGILGARLGFPVLDPAAGVVICIFIEKAAFDIFKDSMEKMIDKSCPKQVMEQMRVIVEAQRGVAHIDTIKTRLFGTKIYVDVEFSTDGRITLTEAHGIAVQVHDSIEEQFPEVKHCMVHVNPMEHSD